MLNNDGRLDEIRRRSGAEIHQLQDALQLLHGADSHANSSSHAVALLREALPDRPEYRPASAGCRRE